MTRIMKKRLLVTFALLCVVGLNFGQILSWQFHQAPGGGKDVTYNATTVHENMEASVLTRGAGAQNAGSGSSNSFNGEFSYAETREAAVANQAYFEFKVKPKAGYYVSLSDLDCIIRIANVNSFTYQYAYSIDGTNFTFIGKPEIATNTVNNGAQVPTVDLGVYSELKNISSAQSVTIRLYAWDGVLTVSGKAACFALGKSLSATHLGLSVRGLVTNSKINFTSDAKIASWDLSALSGITEGSVYGKAVEGLNIPALLRGEGLKPASLNFAYVSNVSLFKSLSEAKENGLYYQLSLSPVSGCKVDISGIKYKYRAVASAPKSYQWAYSIDNGHTFVDIPSASGDYVTSSDGEEYQFDFSDIDALKGVNTGVLLRMYVWGGTNAVAVSGFGRHVYTNNSSVVSSIPIESVYIRGNVEGENNLPDDAVSMDESRLGSVFYKSMTENTKDTYEAKSTEFVVERDYLNFKINGAYNPFMLAINLWHEGRIVRSSTGNDDFSVWADSSWDISELKGKTVWLQVVDSDAETEKMITVSNIFQSNVAKGVVTGEIKDQINRAKEFALFKIESNKDKAAADPHRPTFHFSPVAQRMNDPNGTFYANGYYHLFYQHNPLADYSGGGYMLWGHARSKNLVDWEYLPIGLWPNWEYGGLHCYSGGAFKKADGTVMQFYTDVPAPGLARSQWMAVAEDADYVNWKNYVDHPVMPYSTETIDPGKSWRDPFVFEDGGRVFALLTGTGGVLIYEAKNEELTSWEYRGLFCEFTKAAECPNFFRIKDNKWVLLVSPQNPVEYIVGTFDPETATFTCQNGGNLNDNNQYYATQGAVDDQGRQILFGLIKGFKNNMGWRDCLALPRVLTFDDNGIPYQKPIPELAMLRGDEISVSNISINSNRMVLDNISGDVMELYAEFEPGTAESFGIRIRCSEDGSRNFEIRYENEQLIVPGRKEEVVPVSLPPINGKIRIHIFIDKGAIEVFAEDGKFAATRVYYAEAGDDRIEVFANGGIAILSKLQAWKLDLKNISTSVEKTRAVVDPKITLSQISDSILLKSQDLITHVSIMDMGGRYVFQQAIDSVSEALIPIGFLSKGPYIMQVNHTYTHKFIKGEI